MWQKISERTLAANIALSPAGGGLVDQQDSGVFGMSASGQVVTGLFWRTVPGGSAHGFSWTQATGMVDMGSDGGSSRIDGASADGSVLAGWLG